MQEKKAQLSNKVRQGLLKLLKIKKISLLEAIPLELDQNVDKVKLNFVICLLSK